MSQRQQQYPTSSSESVRIELIRQDSSHEAEKKKSYAEQLLESLFPTADDSSDNKDRNQQLVRLVNLPKRSVVKFRLFRPDLKAAPDLQAAAQWARDTVLHRYYGRQNSNPNEPGQSDTIYSHPFGTDVHPHNMTICQDCVLIIQRKGPDRRLVGAETGTLTELVLALQQAGHSVQIARLERLSPAHQVLLFASAKAVVAVHGAALANIAWMRPGTTVVEITVDYGFGCYYDTNQSKCLTAPDRKLCDLHDNFTRDDYNRAKHIPILRNRYSKADYHNLSLLLGLHYRAVRAAYSSPHDLGYPHSGNSIARMFFYVHSQQIVEALADGRPGTIVPDEVMPKKKKKKKKKTKKGVVAI